eukprot:TRINITY_DN4453_c0_g1_i4.p1 TRINITY_DN4453_c0_g1~~TRINITY_DN4453_c0_g1_i4.p1  ORF type:complete len:500 (+),score=161.77 TRINITY_DN4453_c0_g1_i4:1131-2630(+)
MKNTSHAQAEAAVQETMASISECDQKSSEAKAKLVSAEKSVKEIEAETQNSATHKKTTTQESEQRVCVARKAHTEAVAVCKQISHSLEQLTLEIAELKDEQNSLKSQIFSAKKDFAALQVDVSALETNVARKRDEYESAKTKVEEKKSVIHQANTQLADLQKQRDLLERNINDAQLEIKKSEHKAKNLTKEQQDAEKQVVSLTNQHKWIATEKSQFGKPHTDFDFRSRSVEEAQERLRVIVQEQQKLSKTINKKVMSMFDKAEQDLAELQQKKAIVEADRAKIEQVIEELDKKKNEALEATWKKVNRDFSSIFSTLLPGALCKLTPPEGLTVFDGLEVRVGFGGVWKESLSELSGGQRSLLALSLILSLLLFKPAPMYILDEVDAALDLSHTQNIGQMLRTHFSHSQFIVVSLKEGMFNNANVIFRTKFIDGVSTVSRSIGGGRMQPPAGHAAAPHPAEGQEDDDGENTRQKSRKKTAAQTAGQALRATSARPVLADRD